MNTIVKVSQRKRADVWLALCLIPMMLLLSAIVHEVNDNLEKYHACMEVSAKHIPASDAAICCMPPQSGFSHIVQQPGQAMLHVTNERLIILNALHGELAGLVYLFLTPCLLLIFGLATAMLLSCALGGRRHFSRYYPCLWL